MRSFLLTVAVVQILQCSGVPSPKAALRTSLMKLNEMTNTPNLYGITRRRLRAMYPTGKLTYNVDLIFSVKETTCSKNSGLDFDSPLCRLRPAQTTEKGVCRSRVKYFADAITDVQVHCRGLKSFKRKIHYSESRDISQEVKSKSTETLSKEVESREIESKEVKSKEATIGTAKSRLAKAKSALYRTIKFRTIKTRTPTYRAIKPRRPTYSAVRFRAVKTLTPKYKAIKSRKPASTESREVKSRDVESSDVKSTEVESNETSLEISNECSRTRC